MRHLPNPFAVGPREIWLRYWRLRSWYHAYEVEGEDNLHLNRAALIVGYHGRPVAADLCMLSVRIFERYGYLPHGIIHRAFTRIPVLSSFYDQLGFLEKDGEALDAAVQRKEHIIVTPGGSREGFRQFWNRYRVNWGERVGYLKLAIKYDLPIIPVVADGVDDMYIGFNDGYQLGRQLNIPLGIPCWMAVGPNGVWPFTLPFPTPIHQVLGKAIDLSTEGLRDPNDHTKLLKFHQHLTATVQDMLDRLRASRSARVHSKPATCET